MVPEKSEAEKRGDAADECDQPGGVGASGEVEDQPGQGHHRDAVGEAGEQRRPLEGDERHDAGAGHGAPVGGVAMPCTMRRHDQAWGVLEPDPPLVSGVPGGEDRAGVGVDDPLDRQVVAERAVGLAALDRLRDGLEGLVPAADEVAGVVDLGLGVQERQARAEWDDGVGDPLQGVDHRALVGLRTGDGVGDAVEGVLDEGADQQLAGGEVAVQRGPSDAGVVTRPQRATPSCPCRAPRRQRRAAHGECGRGVPWPLLGGVLVQMLFQMEHYCSILPDRPQPCPTDFAPSPG